MTEKRSEELRKAFEKVQPKSHWKAKINKIIPKPTAKEESDIQEAVIFYTGSVP